MKVTDYAEILILFQIWCGEISSGRALMILDWHALGAAAKGVNQKIRLCRDSLIKFFSEYTNKSIIRYCL